MLLGCDSNEGVTPLMLAARSGNVQELSTILKSTENIDQKSKYGWTALMFASWQGHEKCVTTLLNAGADLNITSKYVPSSFETVAGHPPTTALAESIRNHHLNISEILIDRGAILDMDSIALAGGEDSIYLLEKMKKKGASFNQPSKSAFFASPLCVASQSGNIKIIKWLLENGSDPNLIARGQTALKEAVKGNNPEVVEYFLEHGADPNLIFDATFKETALYYAVSKYTDDRMYSQNFEVIKNLLTHGADKSHQTTFHQPTALEFLIKQRQDASTTHNDKTIEKRLVNASKHRVAIIELLKNFN